MFGRLDKYLLKTAFTPMAISLLIAALLLILEQMLRLLDFVLNENGPVDVVWRMLAYLVPHYLSLALPLSVFLGAVLAVRKLSLSSEYDALLASGLSPLRILRPLFLMSMVMMVINFALLAYVQPVARYKFHELRYELQAGLLGARVPVAKFVEVGKGVRLRIGRTENGGAKLYDLFLQYRNADSNDWSTFTAQRGEFVRAGNNNALILRLYSGRQMIARASEKAPGVLSFDEQDITIPLPDVDAFRLRGGEKREATIGELITLLDETTPETLEGYHEYQASFHYRLVHTFTFFALPFLAFALGQTSRRNPSQAGPVLGLGIVILTHELIEEWGEFQVSVGALSPFETMWPLWAGLLAISLWLFYRTSELPGRRTFFIIEWVSLMVRNLKQMLKGAA